jgi:hypothetical protein
MVRRRAGDDPDPEATGGGALEIADRSKTTGEGRPSWKVTFACIATCLLGYVMGRHDSTKLQDYSLWQVKETEYGTRSSSFDSCSEPIKKGVPTFTHRNHLGDILQQEQMTLGVELGVQEGYFSNELLTRWSSCKEYHLVDVWAPQENYKDVANVGHAEQDRRYQTTLSNTNQWKDKIHVCRNYTTECVRHVPDGYYDFVYVDARHDFKGVYEDLVNWWPKLRKGGILAGHDYVTQEEVGPSQDWTINYDGTKDETGTVVKGAVDKFAEEVCRQVTVEYRQPHWNSWAIRR